MIFQIVTQISQIYKFYQLSAKYNVYFYSLKDKSGKWTKRD